MNLLWSIQQQTTGNILYTSNWNRATQASLWRALCPPFECIRLSPVQGLHVSNFAGTIKTRFAALNLLLQLVYRLIHKISKYCVPLPRLWRGVDISWGLWMLKIKLRKMEKSDNFLTFSNCEQKMFRAGRFHFIVIYRSTRTPILMYLQLVVLAYISNLF